MGEGFRTIEISFAAPVELTAEDQKAIVAVADAICRRFELASPHRTMWPAGIGERIVSMPMTAEDDANGVPMVFDETAFHVECFERANYDWPCARCGHKQGDHRDHITSPPAGACDFSPAPRPTPSKDKADG